MLAAKIIWTEKLYDKTHKGYVNKPNPDFPSGKGPDGMYFFWEDYEGLLVIGPVCDGYLPSNHEWKWFKEGHYAVLKIRGEFGVFFKHQKGFRNEIEAYNKAKISLAPAGGPVEADIGVRLATQEEKEFYFAQKARTSHPKDLGVGTWFEVNGVAFLRIKNIHDPHAFPIIKKDGQTDVAERTSLALARMGEVTLVGFDDDVEVD